MGDYFDYAVTFRQKKDKYNPEPEREITITASDDISAMRIVTQLYGSFRKDYDMCNPKSLEIIGIRCLNPKIVEEKGIFIDEQA